ncbi:MAG: exo-beta-1,3-glucanase (GH17 family) [Glaciecola sp.]|jgi:exo-beta-1,3-glucanase (GH17 family)
MFMKNGTFKLCLLISASIFVFACSGGSDTPELTPVINAPAPLPEPEPEPEPTPLPLPQPMAQVVVNDNEAPLSKDGEQILGNANFQAISYGPFRQATREEATVPSVAELKEDMLILEAIGIKVLRTYNTRGYSDTANLLIAIDELKEADPDFEMYIMLGVWIQAQGSYTSFVNNAVEDSVNNRAEVDKAIEMVQNYPDIIKVIAIGNEAMVDWQAHDVPVRIILNYVNELQGLKAEDTIPNDVWITSSDNHAVWSGTDPRVSGQLDDLDALIAAVDYISLHTYPFHDTHHASDFWKVPAQESDLSTVEKIDAAIARSQARVVEQYMAAQAYMLDLGINKPIHIGETGWATKGSPGGEDFSPSGSAAADEYKQKLAHDTLRDWSNRSGVSLFFFEAFDEQWKAGTQNPASHPEKNFGLINLAGEAKYLLWDMVDAGVFDDLQRGGLQIIKSYGGNEAAMMNDVFAPPSAPAVNVPAEGQFIVLGDSLYEGGFTYSWEGTASVSVNNETGVLTIGTSPSMAKLWGWGAGVGIDQDTSNLSNSTKMTFEIRGNATFGFYLGFQTTLGDSTSHWVRFNNGNYTLTDLWTSYTIDLSQFSNFSSANLETVNSPFTISDLYGESGGSAPTDSTIEIRNIAWLE